MLSTGSDRPARPHPYRMWVAQLISLLRRGPLEPADAATTPGLRGPSRQGGVARWPPQFGPRLARQPWPRPEHVIGGPGRDLPSSSTAPRSNAGSSDTTPSRSSSSGADRSTPCPIRQAWRWCEPREARRPAPSERGAGRGSVLDRAGSQRREPGDLRITWVAFAPSAQKAMPRTARSPGRRREMLVRRGWPAAHEIEWTRPSGGGLDGGGPTGRGRLPTPGQPGATAPDETVIGIGIAVILDREPRPGIAVPRPAPRR